MLTDLQIARYSRQIILPNVGGRGQQLLLSAAVTVAGRAEMARVTSMYLAAAGIGRLFVIGEERGICDDLETLNPDCQVTPVASPLGDDPMDRIVGQSVAVICADADEASVARLHTRCLVLGRPLLFGRVAGAVGEAALLGGGHGRGPCLECFSHNSMPDRAERSGVPRTDTANASSVQPVLAGAIGGFIGTVVAMEAIKLTLEQGSMLMGRRLTYDVLAGRVSAAEMAPLPNCAVCGLPEVGATSAECKAP